MASRQKLLASADGQLMRDVSSLRQDLVRSLEAVQTDLTNISQNIAALDKRTNVLQQNAAADSKDLADLQAYVGELQEAVAVLQERVTTTESMLRAVDERASPVVGSRSMQPYCGAVVERQPGAAGGVRQLPCPQRKAIRV